MSTAVLRAQKAALITALKTQYGVGALTGRSTPTSNGRGGFTTTPTTAIPVWVQRESAMRELAQRNIAPDMALVFILNTMDVEPQEGDMVTLPDGSEYRIKTIGLDPLDAVYECSAERGGPSND